MSIIAGKIYDYDWVTQRATTSYPLIKDIPGLNNSFILDALVLVPLTLNTQTNLLSIISKPFRISKIINAPDGYRILISAEDVVIGSTGPIAKNLTLIDLLTLNSILDIRERTYFVYITNLEYKDLQISLYIGDTINYTGGTILLTLDQGILSSFCRSVYLPLVGGVTALNGLSGDVFILALPGISILVDNESNTISIKRLLYTFDIDLKKKLSNYVKTINGVLPDKDGNIQIEGSDCLSILHTGDNTLTILNPCGKPCCTLLLYSTLLTKAILLLTYLKETVRLMIQTMGNNINFMQANLASVLGK